MADGTQTGIAQDGPPAAGAVSSEAEALAAGAMRDAITGLRQSLAGADIRGDVRKGGTDGAEAAIVWLEASLAKAPGVRSGGERTMEEAFAAVRKAASEPRQLASGALTMLDAAAVLALSVGRAARMSGAPARDEADAMRICAHVTAMFAHGIAHASRIPSARSGAQLA